MSDALRDAAARGVQDGSLPPAQAEVMLDRQLRQVPRWLGQNRYNGPSGGANKPDLPEADVAKHPSISADGAHASSGTPTGPTSRPPSGSARSTCARRVLGQRRFSVTPPSRAVDAAAALGLQLGRLRRRQRRRVRDRRVDLPAGQARRPDDGARARPRDRRASTRVSHAYRPKGAPTRTAFNPALSADGRIVAFEATDAGRNGAPSRNGLWVVDREAGASGW